MKPNFHGKSIIEFVNLPNIFVVPHRGFSRKLISATHRWQHVIYS